MIVDSIYIFFGRDGERKIFALDSYFFSSRDDFVNALIGLVNSLVFIPEYPPSFAKKTSRFKIARNKKF